MQLGLIVLAREGQEDAQVVVGLGVVGSQGDRLLQASLGLGCSAESPQSLAEMVVGFGQVGTQGQRGFESRRGRVEFALMKQDVAQVFMGFEVAWPEGDRLLEAGRGLVELPALRVDRPQIVVRFGQVGAQRQDLAASGGRLGQPPGTMFALGQRSQGVQFSTLRRRRAAGGHGVVLRAHPLGDGAGHALKYVGPLTEGRLAEEPHRGIPGRVVAIAQPTPIARRIQRQPNRCAQGPRQMCDRGVRGDHQVEIADHGRGVHERAGRFVQSVGKIEHWKIDRGDLLRAKSFLQADQLHAGQAGQRANWPRESNANDPNENCASLARRCRS